MDGQSWLQSIPLHFRLALFIDSREATGPVVIFCLFPSTVFTVTEEFSVWGTPVPINTKDEIKAIGRRSVIMILTKST